MDINSLQLRAYRNYTEQLEARDDFSDWLQYGDFMELVSTRASLDDQLNDESLNDREMELLRELDARMAEVLIDDDVQEMRRVSEELPVEEWWR